jgi:ABC-type bacteriocin/lantibiotic exporters, contain an N-terminal double-glycine peptidase domain
MTARDSMNYADYCNWKINKISRRQKRRKRRKRRKRIFILFLTVILLAALITAVNKIHDHMVLQNVPSGLASLYERNHDARRFVLDYDKEHNKIHNIDLSKYSDTKSVPLLMQWDERWGYRKYAGDYFALSGCGPTCMSMVYIYLTHDTSKSPAYMANFSEGNGYSSNGEGTKWSFISEGGEKLGLNVTEIPLDKQRIDNNLDVGNPIICIMGPGRFTSTGHFIVLAGKTGGRYKINDPNSRRRSKRLWTYDEFSDQIKDLWVLRK